VIYVFVKITGICNNLFQKAINLLIKSTTKRIYKPVFWSYYWQWCYQYITLVKK